MPATNMALEWFLRDAGIFAIKIILNLINVIAWDCFHFLHRKSQ